MADQINSLVPRIGVAALSSPLEIGADLAPKAAADLEGLLKVAGCEVVQLGQVGDPAQAIAGGKLLAENHVDAVAFVTTSWYEDYLAIDLLEYCKVPVLLWSLPGMETGALCGSQQLTCFLKQLDHPYDCVFGPLVAGANLNKTKTFLQAAALKRLMRQSRVGIAGHRVAGMTECAVSEFALKKAVGPRLVPLDLPQLLDRVSEMPSDEAKACWADVTTRAACCNVDDATGLDSMKVYLTVKELVDAESLAALTIGCYPHLMGRVCLAASLLADQGIPMGCEGDANGATAQLMLTKLTGQPTHNTDWLEPLPDGSVVMTHCGSGSFDLAENASDITLNAVRLMDQGVCALFPAKPGPVTLLNLIPSGAGYQLAMLEGQALSTEMVFPGNPLRVVFDTPSDHLLDWIHAEGIGHHWMAGYGHVGDVIRQWTKLAGSDLRFIEA
jgi:L-fucose isomerase-like protein